MTNVTLNTAKLALLNTVYADIIADYAPAGFDAATFTAKKPAIAAIGAACAAGNLAVTFDGDKALIVDLMDKPEGEGNAPAIEASEGGEAPESEGDEAPEATDYDGPGDGKGKARDWGFTTASDAWLEANPRGSAAREAYRKERRKAARMARKAARDAKDAAREAANA